jgi:hypothetical protein
MENRIFETLWHFQIGLCTVFKWKWCCSTGDMIWHMLGSVVCAVMAIVEGKTQCKYLCVHEHAVQWVVACKYMMRKSEYDRMKHEYVIC